MDDIIYPRVHMADEFALLVTVGEVPFFTYRYSPELMKPYLYPVHGPSGAEVTHDGHPDDPAHKHHHSIWIGHRDVNGVNFWEEEDAKEGQIFHVKFTGLEETPAGLRIVAENHWLSTRTGLLLEETRDIVVPPATPGLRLIDMTLTFRGGAREVTLGQTPYGLLGCRVTPPMAARNGGRIVNAQGGVNEAETLGKRSAWVEYEGEPKPGARESVGIVDLEENPRHPPAWHTRDDGWFCPALTRDAPYVIRPNEALTLRYLLVFRTEDADASQADALNENVNEFYELVAGT